MDQIKENGFTLKKPRSRPYPGETIPDVDYADDLTLLANTPSQAKFQLYNLEQVTGGIGTHVNADKTEYMCFTTPSGRPLKLVDKFIYLGSNISSIESDVHICLVKACTAIDRLSIWKFDIR